MLDYKAQQLENDRPGCAVELLPVDLTDGAARRAAIARGAAGTPCGLGICEGLLLVPHARLGERTGARPARRARLPLLAHRPRLARALKMMERAWGRMLEAGNAPMRFAPAEGTAFFAPPGCARSSSDPVRRVDSLGAHHALRPVLPVRRRAVSARQAGGDPPDVGHRAARAGGAVDRRPATLRLRRRSNGRYSSVALLAPLISFNEV